MKLLKVITVSFITTVCTFSQEEVIKLEDSVILSTSGFETSILSENKNVTLLLKEQIDNGNYKSVEDVLRGAPNVIVQDTYFGPRVDIRGNGEKAISKVKILSDGVSLNPIDDAMGTLPINTISLNSIEKIEIIPGGGTVLNGSGSSGGVVNIITKSSSRKDFLVLESGIKSYDFRNTGLSIGQNLTEGIYGNFNYNYLKGDGYRDGDSQESNSFSGGIDYLINDKNKLKFQMSYFDENRDYSTGIDKELLEKDRKAMGFPVISNSKRESYSLDYEYKFSDSFTLLNTFYYQNYKRDFTENSFMNYEIPKLGHMPFDIIGENLPASMNGRFKEDTKGFKTRGKYTYEKGELVLGYDYSYTKLLRDSKIRANGEFFPRLRPNTKIKGDVSIDLRNDIFKETNAIYGLNRYSLGERWELILGARYEHSRFGGSRESETEIISMSKIHEYKSIEDEKKSDNYAFEIGTNYKYSESGTFYTRYERGFTSPLPGQITDKVNMTYISNDLKSETSDNFEMGVRDFLGDTFINLSLFLSFTNDEIMLIQKNAHNPAIKEWQYKNLNEVRKFGGELYLEQYFGKITTYESFSYVNTEITKGMYSGEELPMVPKGKLILGAGYEVTDKIKLNANFNFIGSYLVKEYGKDNNTIDTKVSSYNYTDLMVTYEITEIFNVSFGVNNIFNQKYNYEETTLTAVPAPGINYFISGKLHI
ncbi:TonB-dependent receptor [uncultured Cetobacterium sp.]|uniref:TonB-dependent receptor n=1 Tax=uncultured Cetobacterium sp. TaxID=527638 RepID=UPI002625B61D|nr:TonB-dependent receptor [uncultured Cetobacterium sp.]